MFIWLSEWGGAPSHLFQALGVGVWLWVQSLSHTRNDGIATENGMCLRTDFLASEPQDAMS
jgi:hypothetical protein